MYLSYSGHKKFAVCPRSYWHTYIDETPPEKPDNKVNSLFGSVVGLLFEAFYATRLWSKSGVEALLLGMAEETLDKTIERESRSGVVDFTDKFSNYKSKAALLKDVREAVPRGIAIIRYHRLLGTDAEAEVKLDSDIGGHRIGGRADFVMTRITPHGDLVILDGKGSKHREKYVDPWQLKWYAMLWRERYHTLPDALGFVFWRYEPNLSLDWVPYTPGELDELRATVVRDATEIEESKTHLANMVPAERLAEARERFPAKPSGDCKLCSYRTLCPEGRAYTSAAVPPAFYLEAGVEDIGLLERVAMTPEEIRKRVERALSRKDTVDKAKAALGGQLQAKQEELAAVVQEIRAAGYEPKNLAQARDKAQAELEQLVTTFEKDLDAAESAIAALKK